MAKDDTLSERVGARISPELKTQIQSIIGTRGFDSEADVVRAALWQYVEQLDEQPHSDVESVKRHPQDSDETALDRIEWALSVIIILIAIAGSRILNTLREDKIKPAELADEAIQESVYNHSILWQKLRDGRHANKETRSG